MALLTISSKSTNNMSTDGTTYLKAKVNKVGDKHLAGITILLKYTKGDETGINVTQNGIFPAISATDTA